MTTKLPVFLLGLTLFSCILIYMSASLINKSMTRQQQAEHAMLRPSHNHEQKQQPHSQKLMLRTTKKDTRKTPFPRIIAINENGSTKLFTTQQSNNYLTNSQEDLSNNNSDDDNYKTRSSYDYRDPLYENDCVPMQSWQTTSFPTCSTIHELDFYSKVRTSEFQYLTGGGYNDIFTIQDKFRNNGYGYDPKLAVKILQEGTKYTDRNFDRVRRDGLILERSTKSKFVMNIYGFCGFLVLVPYADGGTLSRELHRDEDELSSVQKLQYAYEVSAGLAAVHDIDGEKLSAVTQGDLKADQYLFMDGVLKLGDFNRGRFLRRNSTQPDTACTYTIGVNDAAYRSPEEYKYLPETSAIDVWAIGSLIYHILHGHEVWHRTSTKKAQKYIMRGELPEIDERYLKSDDPAIKAMLEAIDLCYVYDPEKRAKAWDVSSFLEKKLKEVQSLES